MKQLVAAISLTLLLCLAVACDKAPSGIIPESKMEDLLVDLELADAFVESHHDQFMDDSSRLVLKQSIMADHGVTPELYDTSLVWYARNMDVYIAVYDKVIARLERMRDKGESGGGFTPNMDQQPNAVRRSFAAQGDSADLWHGNRRWMLTANMGRGFIPFDIEPDKEYARGDRYELMFALRPMRSTFRTFIAVDYVDGGTAYTHHFSQSTGWNIATLQSDSTRDVRRIYGYVLYSIQPGDIAYVDSLTLLRTHYDRKTYAAVGGVKTVERIKREPAQPVEPAAAATPAPASAPQQGRDTSAIPVATQQPQGAFKPKEGVNKSSAQRHVTTSPNARHLPQGK